jgi:hypothetical protein
MTKQQPILVHKEGEEGVLTIDRLTGRITTPHDDRPDWAEGYATAMLAERQQFYAKRLGQESTSYQSLMDAAAIEASDLSWIGVDAEGDEREIEASSEYRNGMLAQALGVNEETGEISGTILAEHEVDRDMTARTPAEYAALEQSVEQGFGPGQQEGRKEATN